MDTQSKAIGKALKARRLKKARYEANGKRPIVYDEWTQAGTASRIGCSFRTYQAWEGGETVPARKWDAGIVKVFGVTVSQLEREGNGSR